MKLSIRQQLSEAQSRLEAQARIIASRNEQNIQNKRTIIELKLKITYLETVITNLEGRIGNLEREKDTLKDCLTETNGTLGKNYSDNTRLQKELDVLQSRLDSRAQENEDLTNDLVNSRNRVHIIQASLDATIVAFRCAIGEIVSASRR